MAPLSAVLSSKDHKLDLKSLPATDVPAADRFVSPARVSCVVCCVLRVTKSAHTPYCRSRRVLLGVPAIDAIIQALAERGIRGTSLLVALRS
jgi:hypothetical protein